MDDIREDELPARTSVSAGVKDQRQDGPRLAGSESEVQGGPESPDDALPNCGCSPDPGSR
jgi:hypothetical protein